MKSTIKWILQIPWFLHIQILAVGQQLYKRLTSVIMLLPSIGTIYISLGCKWGNPRLLSISSMQVYVTDQRNTFIYRDDWVFLGRHNDKGAMGRAQGCNMVQAEVIWSFDIRKIWDTPGNFWDKEVKFVPSECVSAWDTALDAMISDECWVFQSIQDFPSTVACHQILSFCVCFLHILRNCSRLVCFYRDGVCNTVENSSVSVIEMR